ncbi:MAG: class I SAM-dependent methyltransferase [Rhodospirillaceae bacterium]|jgi:ubiquinone/menaquinone biosynthesis C-methylase UbiE|nr:class I SAM-dependent methyltransferase [Rhodospirillaceae bacterium]MBT3931708.1 class I SAM-dependent methyltransferase [Rhodospirillaceae bacterium]MBT4774060.1 class I SAM-dependent methyltransferase [Rhodospirillaceae bacterium]MBT5358623.1 class I SAM-dependent methyltransferase [Rhodospirillaceae bacterium]MBT5768755.1 class I SAM-dependent methyltransferase [Rhodospirillaceae bacterium]
MVRARHGDAESDDGYIPFLERFRRWWNGDRAPISGDGSVSAEPGAEGDPEAITRDSPEDTGLAWTEKRVSFCRRLWAISDEDNEMVEPGGARYIDTLLQPAALNSSKSALDLSAGLGGGVRRMVGGLGLWVTASDPDRELVGRAQKLSVRRGLAKRAPITVYDPDTLELPENKFHAVLLRERLFRMRDKQAVLKTIRMSLKTGGSLIMTDFVLATDKSGASDPVTAWTARETEAPHLWTMEACRDVLEGAGLQVRSFEDASTRYRQMILAGWAQFIDGLKREELTRDFVNTMMREAEYWVRLERALGSGELVYLHCHALLPNAPVTR